MHGSDSAASAEREIGMWFEPAELVEYELAGSEWVRGES